MHFIKTKTLKPSTPETAHAKLVISAADAAERSWQPWHVATRMTPPIRQRQLFHSPHLNLAWSASCLILSVFTMSTTKVFTEATRTSRSKEGLGGSAGTRVTTSMRRASEDRKFPFQLEALKKNKDMQRSKSFSNLLKTFCFRVSTSALRASISVSVRWEAAFARSFRVSSEAPDSCCTEQRSSPLKGYFASTLMAWLI